jgi:hypothetical protein
MKKSSCRLNLGILVFILITSPRLSSAWFDETHLAIAKAAGYYKWYNACGADMAKIKAGKIEAHNHYANNPRGSTITPEMVLKQARKYNQVDRKGHLYGAIIASIRDYLAETRKGKYAEYHLAFCVHYVGDLSMPLHNTVYNSFNKRNHKKIDGVINDGVMENLDRIKMYSIKITSEEDLAKEIARIANLSMKLGYKIEDKGRILTEQEAYEQISHSASLFKAILKYVEEMR